MAKRVPSGLAIVAAWCFCLSAVPSAGESVWEIPFKLRHGWIVIEAAYGGVDGLKFSIDTGSTCSLLDKALVKKLRLEQEPGECSVWAFGRLTKAKRFYLPGLKMGPISTSLRCLEADLSQWWLDGIIGLDLLRQTDHVFDIKSEAPARKTLTIDFRAHKIRFGESMELEQIVPLEADSHQIVVAAGIQDRRVRLALDTGTKVSVLFRGSQQDWIDALPIVGYMTGTRLTGGYQQIEVLLRNFVLGTTKCNDMSAIVSEARNQPIDGLLAILQLDPKIIHFDFDRNLMTWKK